ncbi:hypothetical protein HanIR_Chr12g0584301 [Helianthus annuus]|nr:hypothetical protein HanIR_Chr12g0584301 [Helianthus annuus]
MTAVWGGSRRFFGWHFFSAHTPTSIHKTRGGSRRFYVLSPVPYSQRQLCTTTLNSRSPSHKT